jgi:3-oxoacyl-[acyl-carrier-protein] synthase II
MNLKRRVVVTGLGIVSPVGNSVKTAWSNILSGQSGISSIDYFDTADYTTRISGAIKDFDVTGDLDSKSIRRYDEFIQYGCYAACRALEDSNLVIDDNNAPRIGVAIGSGIGGLTTIERNTVALYNQSPRRVSPFYIPGSIINSCSGLVSQILNCQGLNLAMVSACASGAHSIGYAARTIAYGDVDVMLSGASEKGSSRTGIAGFSSMKALSTRNDDPERASRPWDKDRDGFVLGDGAAVLVLEEYEHAKARGAKIYAELIGFGMSSDAYHITAPEPSGRGMLLSMQNALNDAGINPGQIDYVNAHGTSTPLADPLEHNSVKHLLHADNPTLPMSSTKSMTGHLLGAAGAIEAVFSILAIRDNVAPPTINLDHPDDGCDMNLVPHESQEHTINYVLSNSFGFGGTNASLIFSSV